MKSKYLISNGHFFYEYESKRVANKAALELSDKTDSEVVIYRSIKVIKKPSERTDFESLKLQLSIIQGEIDSKIKSESKVLKESFELILNVINDGNDLKNVKEYIESKLDTL